MAAGLIDADLGGSVYKKRLPLPGRGKSGNEQANIDDRELAALRKLASTWLSMTSSQLEHSVAEKELMESGGGK